jgi:hypothetical protein
VSNGIIVSEMQEFAAERWIGASLQDEIEQRIGNGLR